MTGQVVELGMFIYEVLRIVGLNSLNGKVLNLSVKLLAVNSVGKNNFVTLYSQSIWLCM